MSRKRDARKIKHVSLQSNMLMLIDVYLHILC